MPKPFNIHVWGNIASVKSFGCPILIIFLIGAILILQSCKDDDPVLPPKIEIPAIDVLESSEYLPEEEISFGVEGIKGSFDLVLFWVEMDGSLLSQDDFIWNGGFIPMNPYELNLFETDGFDFNIRLQLPDNENSQSVFSFYVKDENETVSSVEIMFQTGTSTPISLSSGKLYNSNSESNGGGIDLNNGRSVALDDPAAELINLANQGGSWRSFGPSAGTELRKSNLIFGEVLFLEEIIKSFESSADLTSANPSLGDIYTIKNGSEYFLVKIDEFAEDPGGDNDFIRMQIKR